MKRDKAFEYFSEYREGTLEAGLKQQMDRLLSSDSALRDEYEAFDSALKAFESSFATEIEPPADLHERISARLDKAIFDQSRKPQGPFMTWWRIAVLGLGLAGATTALIFATRSGTPSTNDAGAVPTISNPAPTHLRVEAKGREVTLRYTAKGNETVTLSQPGGTLLKSYDLVAKQQLNAPLTTDMSESQVMEITVTGGKSKFYVALPGLNKKSIATGNGTLIDFAKHMADFYEQPVYLETSQPGGTLQWELNPTERITPKALSMSNLTIELQGDLIRVRG
jgi:hypothetical protein